MKYGLDYNKLNLSLFDKMLNFLIRHANEKPSMKGIIDYEIAKFLCKNEFYIPIYYATTDRILAKLDELFNSNYPEIANDVVNKTLMYLSEVERFDINSITIQKILEPFSPNRTDVYHLIAYKISF